MEDVVNQDTEHAPPILYDELKAYEQMAKIMHKLCHVGVSLNGPKHPKKIIFSRKPHGCRVPPL